MPRKPRPEAEGAVYHLINRGNYRKHIFVDDGAKASLLDCYDETCVKTGWITFAWAVIINHFHSATLTPQPNLVDGMQWWQGTFAKRFNRYRGEHGHLFQGRYQSIRADPETRLGPLCHYIHLNPVRAKVVSVEQLPNYPWTSMHWLMHPEKRPRWYEPRAALEHAGNLPDTQSGWKQYLEYLHWLAEDKAAQKAMRFDRMTKGWAMGSPEFLHDLVVKYSRGIERDRGVDDEA